MSDPRQPNQPDPNKPDPNQPDDEGDDTVEDDSRIGDDGAEQGAEGDAGGPRSA